MISVIIPTYKNNGQFLANLRHNLPYVKDCEIIAVNDNPIESLNNLIDSRSKIILIENKKNLGFGESVNKGVTKATSPYIMLLNDDVILKDNSYEKVIDYFKKDKKLFAISFAQKEKDGSFVGKNIIYWQNGFFQHRKADDLKPGINGWAEGGACLIDKEKYEKIGGFDRLYSPFYWEDVDLCYRAWKTGYQILFDPSIVVTHYHESTIGKQFEKEKIKEIAYRNQFIFIWKNITDKKLLITHTLKTILSLPIMIFKNQTFVYGFWKAIFKFPVILQHRYKGVLSDEEILNKFK